MKKKTLLTEHQMKNSTYNKAKKKQYININRQLHWYPWLE